MIIRHFEFLPASPQGGSALPLIESGARLETAVSIVFTEGPAADAEGNVYFTEITGNRIMRWGAPLPWLGGAMV